MTDKEKQQLIDKACRWWEDEFWYPTMTEFEEKGYREKNEEFRKAMNDDRKAE